MTDWFLRGGLIMWPLLTLALGEIALGARAVVELRRIGGRAGRAAGGGPATSAGEGPTLTPILFWGAMALLVGAIGTVAGIVIVARRVSAAGSAGAGLIWGGVGVALISLTFGILIFLLSGCLWLALNRWRRALVECSAGTAPACLLLPLVFLSAGCGAADGESFVLADSAGVAVASNVGPDRPFPATPVRLASLQPPDGALTAVPWGVVADPATGRIFAADATGERVVAFEPDGAFAFTIGRAGDGPGEFRSPTALALDGPGVLAVWDARRGVISRWSADGEMLGEQRATPSWC